MHLNHVAFTEKPLVARQFKVLNGNYKIQKGKQLMILDFIFFGQCCSFIIGDIEYLENLNLLPQRHLVLFFYNSRAAGQNSFFHSGAQFRSQEISLDWCYFGNVSRYNGSENTHGIS